MTLPTSAARSLPPNLIPAVDLNAAPNQLVAAFEAGRLVNRLAWHLTQYAMLCSEEHREQWKQTLGELAGKAIEIGQDIASKRNLGEWISARCNEWDGWEFRDECYTASQTFKDGPHPLACSDQEIVSAVFEKTIEGTIEMHASVRRRFEVELKNLPEKASLAFLLGETVDQGLHPRNVAQRLFERVRSPEWSIFIHRYPAMRKRRRADPLAIPKAPYSGLTMPPKFVLRGRSRHPGELSPPTHWSETINSLCTQLGIRIPAGSLFQKANRRGGDPEILILGRRAVVKTLVNLFNCGLAQICTKDDNGLQTGAPSAAPPVRSDVTGAGAVDKLEVVDAKPAIYLTSWREILDCLEMRNIPEDRRKVTKLNRSDDGPIILPKQGGQPKVEKTKLIGWWDHLAALWETQGGGGNAKASVEGQHPYGKSGTVVPEIEGHVKKKRKDKK